MRTAFPDEGAEVAEVIAAHLNDAYKAAGDDPDADELRSEAKDAYVLAAERAESVGALEAAEAAYLTAAELSADEAEQADLTEKAGRMAVITGFYERALGHFEAAVAAHNAAGRVVDTARVTTGLARALHLLGRGEQAIVRIHEASAFLDPDTAPPSVVADLQGLLGVTLIQTGHPHEAVEPIEQALRLAQHYELAEPLASSLLRKADLFSTDGRVEESRLNYEGSLSVARRNGLTRVEMIAENNLAYLCMIYDLPGAEEHIGAALALTRRWGARPLEASAAANLMYVLAFTGRFEEAYRLGIDVLQTGAGETEESKQLHARLALLDSLCGRAGKARQHLDQAEAYAESDNVEYRAAYAAGESGVCLAEGNFRLALEAAVRAIDEFLGGRLEAANESVRLAFPDAIDAAMAVGDVDEADRLIGTFASRPPGEIPPFLRAQILRAGALVGAARGEDEGVEEGLSAAEEEFSELGYPYWTARAQLDLAEWLSRRDRRDEAADAARKAAATFERLGTQPMLVRAQAASEAPAEVS